MAKSRVPWQQYLQQTLDALGRSGLLLTSIDSKGRPNAMTIGWASFGIQWGQPILTVMVRPSRYTFGCIEMTNDFVVSVPYASLDEQVLFCGTNSGRDVDKFSECRFTLLPTEAVRSPGIAECGVNYYCRVVHRNDVLESQLDAELKSSAYPQGDYHRFYAGLIEVVLADDDFAERCGG